jgi:hypothetical protein
MNAQEIFDKVASHLAKQKVRSGAPEVMENGQERLVCKYRGPNGTMCAFGIFISEENYRESMEGCNVYTIMHVVKTGEHIAGDRKFLTEKLVAELKPLEAHTELLRELQRIHDQYDVEEWADGFARAASRWGLKFDQFAFEQELNNK